MDFGFAQHLGYLRHAHLLGVSEPQRLELSVGQPTPSELPQIARIFTAREQFGRIVMIQLFRHRFVGHGQPTAVMVNAGVASEGKKPRGELAPRIKPSDSLKGPDEGVLRNFRGIGTIAARMGNEAVDAMPVAMNQFFKRFEGAGLRSASQLLIGNRERFGWH
jgi:hypothetical protein